MSNNPNQAVTVAEQRALSVQGNVSLAVPLTMMSIERKALLPAYGSQSREVALRRLYRHPHNTLVQGIMSGIASKIASTPMEVMGPTEAASQNAQAMLLNACFGKGKDYLLSVTALNYLRHDRGVWWELIGYGNPNGPLIGYPVAVNVLDPLRCYPTGDPDFPIWYYSIRGRVHRIHASRLAHFVDTPDGDDEYPEVGMCGMSRAVAIAEREILSGQYISTRLDDKPKPGIQLFKNIDEAQFRQAETRYLAQRQEGITDQTIFGQVLQLFGVDPHEQAGVEYVSYSEAPEKYDFIAYTNLDAKELAVAYGVDIQEFWELSGGGIGTSTQSQILHEKSKGKTIGRLRSQIETVLNTRVLPRNCEARWKYRDSQEDKERADVASTWATTIYTVSGDLSPIERRQMLANTVEPFADVLLAADGQVRLPDDDRDPAQPRITGDDENPDDGAPAQLGDPEAGSGGAFTKAFTQTGAAFAQRFITLVNQAQAGRLDRRSLGIKLRQQLRVLGERAFVDGIKEAGGRGDLSEDDRVVLQTWLGQQSQYVSHFTDEVVSQGLSDAQLQQRADAWVANSLGEIRLRGMASVKSNQYMRWVMRGGSEHCPTCKRLNGQVHRLRDWLSYDFYPKSSSLVCWSGCQCELEPADGPAQGNLRSVRYVRFRKSRRAKQRRKEPSLWQRLFG